MESSNQYALITGATSGIGLELARLFARDGYNLIIVARDETELKSTAAELSAHGSQVLTIAKNLFDPEEAFALYAEVKQRGIFISVLVNNAGQGLYGEFKDTDIDRELDIIHLNISSLVVLTKSFLTDMIASQSGKILNLASIASKIPGPWQSVYHGTKAFVLSFSEAIREEVKSYGITVTALMPGVTDTDFFNKADMLESKVVQDEDNMADPKDVAQEGYQALMEGRHQVVAGFKNKVQVAINTIMPDDVSAHRMGEQQKPAEE
jgi:short-subunit dehydrogenase